MSEGLLDGIAEQIRHARCLRGWRQLNQLPASVAAESRARLLRGMCAWRLGRSAEARACWEPLLRVPSPWQSEAYFALLELDFFGGHHQRFDQLLESPGPWRDDPRQALFTARQAARTDLPRAVEMLAPGGVLRVPDFLRRLAGFEVVGWLDRLGDYRGAFALAKEIHRATTPPFPLALLVHALQQQLRLLAREPRWFQSRVDPVEGIALIIGLPRSGTTLLEQMLDRHPAMSGLGEYEGIGVLAEGLVEAGVWPLRLGHLDPQRAQRLQAEYLEGARELQRPTASWSVDKSLGTWQWWPAVAALLPGARCLHLARDPRDLAVSQFLADLHPVEQGWIGAIDSLREVLALEQQVSTLAQERLGLATISLTYERLVGAAEPTLRRLLSACGVGFDPAVLVPELNARPVLTLSHAQVRQPVHNRSVGRWRNYDFAFDARWDPLVQHHEAVAARLEFVAGP
jgi:hypothetical protein